MRWEGLATAKALARGSSLYGMEVKPDKPYELVAHVAELQEGGEVMRAKNPFKASDIFYKVRAE